MKVRHSALAEDDLIEIWLYVATENPDAADRLLDRFERRIRLLATQPLSGVARDDLGREIRQVVVGNYLLLYRVEGDDILIPRVLHGRRDLAAENLEE
ncbi:type II toxin-antitoxin system RelE/ParE family toxin [Mesorhizobium sp. 8]|uniref:type II toxin-antitoxin system RelE/ParE family toxin n=1 Tax=Mesorhizobium sp. 8 TaxID=2584466 RepID=UPI001120419A|nr:type II toxin-antitoxin system RelE/ParE family toxin [Mesorhizobium sp. 8]QDC00067.1 type II toxin-antitoxin system RelE/ParE family toxin [Mesorhizobium sp. 8]